MAETDFGNAIDIDPNNPEYHANLGLAYYKLEKYDEAKSEFDSAIRLDGSYARAYDGRANLYKTQGQTADAVKDFVNAGKFYNRQAVASNNDIKKQDDLYNSARDMFKAAIASDKNCAEAYYRLGLLETNNSNYRESLPNYDKALDLKISDNLLETILMRRAAGQITNCNIITTQ